MRYLPKSDEERRQMLAEIGAKSIDDLFSSIPAEYRLERDLTVPRQQAESEIVEYFRAAGQKNATDYASFLGAGAYRHYRPVIIDALVQRGEFLTSYTPYQAEITQGTLQAIFEFQTMIAELTGMDVANASMYDGSTGAAEAVMMAVRVTGRSKAVVAATVHPEYREVLATYATHQGLPTTLVGYDAETGRVDLKALDAAVTEETAAVLIQSPNFFGVIEDIPAIAQIAHAKGALLIVSIAEAVSLGIVRPPVEADIVAMEAQSFGVALSYGGPFCGVIAAKEQFVRQMPGRLAGQTVDGAGNRGFVLTLATREQHIRREKATSNICTNQALVALMATIFLAVYGKEGIRELAEHNLAKADYAAKTLGSQPGAKLRFKGAPRFHEFVLQTDESPAAWSRRLLENKIVGGIELSRWYPELHNCTLWCATEVVTARTDRHGGQGAGGPSGGGVRGRWQRPRIPIPAPTPSARFARTRRRTKRCSSRSRRRASAPTSCRRSTCPPSTPPSCLAPRDAKQPGLLPELSEIEIIRHFTRLSTWNYAIDLGMYPLGSCTMKYNPRVNEFVARIEGLAEAHPYRPESLAQGILEIFDLLQRCLLDITGMDAITLQPAAGAHGEFTGILLTRAWHESQGNPRKKVLIPDSAHGTNPATAAIVGYAVENLKSNADGGIDLEALARQVDGETAALMLTNPSTLGVFESQIHKIADILHAKGALALHGRRQHERAGRQSAARRLRRGRNAPEPAQNLLHAPRRRWARLRPRGLQGVSRAVPPHPSPGPRRKGREALPRCGRLGRHQCRADGRRLPATLSRTNSQTRWRACRRYRSFAAPPAWRAAALGI